MKKYLKIATNALCAIGFVLAFLAISTSDYYVIELGQPEPQYVMRLLFVGIAMMLPTVLRFLGVAIKEWCE